MTFAIVETLRDLRLGRGLSQRELAARMDAMDSAHLCRLERGAMVATLPVLERWANALGMVLVLVPAAPASREVR
jgi:transcriptional regulator with XRE-family HTH domain